MRQPRLLLLLALLLVCGSACRGPFATTAGGATPASATAGTLAATPSPVPSPTAAALATPPPAPSRATGSPSPAAASPVASPAAAIDGQLAVVRAGYDLLLDDFYRQLDPRSLLTVAWASLGRDASACHDPAPPALPPLAPDRVLAFASVQDRYRAYQAGLAQPLPATTVAQHMLDAMARSLNDDHTHFLPPATYQSFLNSVTGQEQVGFGMRLSYLYPLVVTRTAPGGPADRAGLKAGDAIVGLNGTNTRFLSPGVFNAALAAAREPTTLTVDRGGEEFDLRLRRGPYFYPPWESRMLPSGVAYLRLDTFLSSGRVLPNGQEILADLDQRLDQFDAQHASGLILDLRDNSGGSVLTSSEILGRFLPEEDLTIHNHDEHGGDSANLVSGQMHKTQLPMVVLVNGGSASSSEATAAALQENGRALLVGTRTAGALATSEILPLPDGSGMQIAVKSVVSAKGMVIDKVGLAIDVAVEDTRTADDYRLGHDPQLDAAARALADAPPPPAYHTTLTALNAQQLDQRLGVALPDPAQLPVNDRLTGDTVTYRHDLTHVNEWIGGDRDPLAEQQRVRARGYEGSVVASYGIGPGQEPSLTVHLDIYASDEGAKAALDAMVPSSTRDVIASPVQLGDQTVATLGKGLGLGSRSITWRHGNVVIGVSYADVPGYDRPDTLVAAARVADTDYLSRAGH